MPNDNFYYDIDVISDNILNKKDLNNWSEKFESSGSDFIYILFSCLFYIKSKTLSHIRESLTFYREAFEKFIISIDNQKTLLSALFDLWGNSFTYLKFISDILINQNCLDHTVFIDFIFERINQENFYFPREDNRKDNDDQNYKEKNSIDSLSSAFDGKNFNDKKEKDKKNLDLKNLIFFKKFYYFDLIENLVENFENSMQRIKKELSKEQESLAISDENLQNGIIKKIEFLEEKIEKILDEKKNLHKKILENYLYLVEKLNFEIENLLDNNGNEENLSILKQIKIFMMKKTEIFVEANKKRINDYGKFIYNNIDECRDVQIILEMLDKP